MTKFEKLQNYARFGAMANSPMAITGFHTESPAASGDTTGTGNWDEVIPELWASAIWGYFERNLVLRDIFDDYSALAKGRGDTINLPEITEVSGLGAKAAGAAVLYQDEDLGTESLTISEHKYVAKMFEDIAVIQSNEQLFSKYAQAMGYQLAKQFEADQITALQGYGTTQAITTDNVLTIAEIETAMNTLSAADVPLEECFLIVNYKIYNDLLTQGIATGAPSSTFATGSANDIVGYNKELAKSAVVPSIFGIPVVKCNSVKVSTSSGDEQAFLAHPTALAYAIQQDIRVQSEYSVYYLATKVVADMLYGSVVRNTTVRCIEFIS